jgi:HlyD family secretion protein
MKKLMLVLLPVLVLVVLGAWLLLEEEAPEGLLIASGRIEGRITTVTPKSAGRIVALPVDEGDTVEDGSVLARLEDDALAQRVNASREQVDALRRQIEAAETRLRVLREETVLGLASARAGLAEARAGSEKAEARLLQARTDAERYTGLEAKKLVSPEKAEEKRLEAAIEEKALLEAQAALTRAEKEVALAELGEARIAAQESERDALLCQARCAEAQAAEQASYLGELTIHSPLSGTVLTRNVEKGEQVSAGMPLFTLVDLNRLYLKVYIPEPHLGRVVLGQRARVYVDAWPERHFEARVSRVAQRAEFTPKNVETREERVKLVFAVELTLEENPGGVLKPGMPADGVIRWREEVPWMRP